MVEMSEPGHLTDMALEIGIERGYWGHGKASVFLICLLYTSPSPRDRSLSRMPSSA